MTISTALTIIAICFAVLTLLVIGLGIVLMVVGLRIIRLEKAITHEISTLRVQLGDLIQTARDSSSRFGETLKEFKQSAYRMGLAATGLAGILEARKHKDVKPSIASKKSKVRPWWISGLVLGYSLWKRRRKVKRPPSSGVPS